MTRHRHVYRWDLDKTYLDTDFTSVRRMVRIALETADQKRSIPGAAALLRELAQHRDEESPSWIAVVSGSPEQMRGTLEEKLRLDGVRWDEFHLKPQWNNLRRGRLRALRNQVGYKLPLLLRSRARLDEPVGETLFGDDAEVDVFIYSLYADVVAQRVDSDQLARVMKAAGAYPEDIDRALESVVRIEHSDVVETIFVHLDQRTPPDFFRPFGPRVVPIFNYFQAALVLFTYGHLDASGVVRVTESFLEEDGLPPRALANLFQDVVRRGHLPGRAMTELGEGISAAVRAGEAGAGSAEVLSLCIERFSALGSSRAFLPPAPPQKPDYFSLLSALRRAPSRG